MALVREFMRKEVTILREDMPIRDAVQTLRDNEVSGAPVVDTDNNLTGFITERDVLNKVREQLSSSGLPMHLSLFDAAFLYQPEGEGREEFLAEAQRIGKIPVSDVMWKKVISVAPDDNVEIALHYLSKYRINSMPVVEDHVIIGLISRRDILDSIFRIMEKEEPADDESTP